MLVDTSAWVTFVRQGAENASDVLDQLLAEKRAAINEVIQAELLIGAQDERHYKEFEVDLGTLPHLLLTAEAWNLVGELGFALRRKGATIPLPDLTIAACAISHQCELFSLDRHFDLIARHAPLKIYRTARAKNGR